jgi:hypothetical protein
LDLREQLQQHLGSAFGIERELGGGGMSRVFLAEEVRLSRRVVIKVLSPELSEGLNAERFEREILLAASLQQANIVPVLAAGRVGNLPYFTMPFVEGESLRQRLAAGALPITEVTSILRDVAKALSYAHARGIVHRDIKPDNVLLSGGTAVVTDFGIAKALSASRTAAPGGTLTQVGTSIGTPAYMAPEQVAGDPDIDHRVDLYSLGAMAFELLTGRLPFADRTPQKMLAAHLSETPPAIGGLRRDCPPLLAELVGRLLEKEPAGRPETAADVSAVLDAMGTSSHPTGALEGPGSLLKAVALWGVATLAAWILAKAATVGIGLPEWVVPGSLIVMGLGLPALLLTGWVRRIAFKVATATPTMTPGGSVAMPSGTLTTMALKASPHLTWRRTARGGMLAMGGFAVVIAAFMVMRSMGIGPAASLFASGQMAADDRVVLASLTAADEDTAFASVVGVAIREAMSQSNSIRILDRADVATVLGEMEREGTAAVTGELAREVAQRAGAKAVLGGTLTRAGANGFAISLELSSATDGSILAAFPGTADGPTDVLEVVDRLARRLRSKIGESLRAVAQSIPLERATTASLPALEHYSRAAYLNDVAFDFDGAVAEGRAAVALDSTFALAWRKIAVASQNGLGSIATRDSALEMAFRYSDRLPDRERHAAMGAYYQNHSAARDRGKAIDAYGALFRIDSTDRIALSNLALAYSATRQLDSAAYYARIDLANDDLTYAPSFLFTVLAQNERFDEARALRDSLIAAGAMEADSWGAKLAEVMLAASAGELEEADVDYRAILEGGPAGMRLAIAGFAPLARLQGGKVQRGVALQDSLARVLAARGNGLALPAVDSAVAALFVLGDPVETRQLLDRAVASPAWSSAAAVLRPYVGVAATYALAGAPGEAGRLLQEFRTTSPAARAPDAAPWIALVEGTIAAANGDDAGALARYRAAMVAPDGRESELADWALFLRAQSHDRLGQADSAVAALERYRALPWISTFSSNLYLLAPAERRLGELYDARGETAKAIERYGAFVNQWRDADPELQPTVASVRARIAELQRQESVP